MTGLTALDDQINKQTLTPPDWASLEEFDKYQQVLNGLINQKNRLETDLVAQIPEMKRLLEDLQTVNQESVIAALPEGVALIEFFLFNAVDFKAISNYNSHYLAFVLPSGKQEKVQMIDLGETKSIDDMINSFRTSITGEKDESREVGEETILSSTPTTSKTSDGCALRSAIFDPLINALDGHARLFIAPDGNLCRLPFEILPLDNGHRLIDEYYVSYLSTGRDILRSGSICRQLDWRTVSRCGSRLQSC